MVNQRKLEVVAGDTQALNQFAGNPLQADRAEQNTILQRDSEGDRGFSSDCGDKGVGPEISGNLGLRLRMSCAERSRFR